jgi:hypothetical protein
MLTMAAAEVYLALAKSKPADVLGGALRAHQSNKPGLPFLRLAVTSVTATWAAQAAKSPTG